MLKLAFCMQGLFWEWISKSYPPSGILARYSRAVRFLGATTHRIPPAVAAQAIPSARGGIIP
jgi:hypothetical protein